jgi:putative ABC transport system permease protein
MYNAFRFALRRLRRGLKSGELRVLVAALTIAATAAVAVGLFTDRVRQAIENGAGDTVGADATLRSRDVPDPALIAQLQALGLRTAMVTEFPSVVAPVAGEATQLATVKAVQPGYPLRGTLKLAPEPFGEGMAAPGVPPRGEVWVDPKLWSALSLTRGAEVQVGISRLRVTAVIVDEPGRGGAFAELAPQLLLNADDLAATQLLGPGSRAEYTIQLGGGREALAAAKAIQYPRGTRYVGNDDSRPEIKRTLGKARQFLNIAVLATVLLAAAATSLTARQWALKLRDEVALLKCLGARQAFIVRALVAQVLLLGLLAGGSGAVLGAIGQSVLAALAGPALNVALPVPSLLPIAAAMALVLLLLGGFALPPVLAAVGTSPVQVFQRAAGSNARMRWSLLAAAASITLLLWLQAGELKLAGIVLAGTAVTAAVLALFAWLLVRLLAGTRSRGGAAWRFGLSNLARRRGATVAQIVALGVALLALLLVTVVRNDLLTSWQNKLPPQTPNEFLINIQPQQVKPLQAFFEARGYDALKLQPLVRSRLTAINGKPITAESFEDPETRRWINREFNLSWTDHFGDDNTLLKGEFWTAADAGKKWLSIDKYGIEQLKVKLGDTLTLDIAGTPVTLEIHSVRDVKWDSFKPNFFLVTPPGVLDAPEVAAPVQWITSFYLPADKRGLLRELVREFPNVTALDLEAALNQVRSIVDKIVHALEFVLLFALIAGVVVMLAVIEGSRAERVRESGVLRALGASSRTLTQGLVAEYAVLGLLAGSVAAFAAQALAWTLAVFVFDIPYGPRPLVWLIGAVAGCVVVTAAGYLSLRGVLRTPPRIVLAGSA